MSRHALVAALVACRAPVSRPPDPPRVVPPPVAVAPAPVELDFPTPPHQHDAWSAPAGPLTDAVTQLIADGLADPRGCEYRAIVIQLGSVWSGDGDKAQTSGWVLPGRELAIAWNGLIYPTLAIGAPGDALADARTAVERSHASKGEAPSRFSATAEQIATGTTQPTAIRALLVARLGEPALAAELWRAYVDKPEISPVERARDLWLRGAFERAVTSHMRGDDRSAAATARLVRAARARLSAAEAEKYDWLAPIDALVEDSERRLQHPHAPLPLPARLRELAPRDRVARLIEQLDEVAARQDGQPGGIDLASDPIVGALVAEGDVAVEPLLDTLEHDTRLTRSVHFWRDFAPHRSLTGVHEAAYAALASILETSFFTAAATGDDVSARGRSERERLAAAVRVYWTRWKSIPLAERWFATLADDAAGPDDWVAAAGKIARPSNVSVHPATTITEVTVVTPEAKPSLRGESLRAHRGPSVTELLVRRAHAATDQHRGCQLALAAWQPSAAVPTLREQLARAMTDPQAAHCTVALAEAAADAGDTAALDAYAAWIVKQAPPEDSFWVGQIPERMFAPMLHHTLHPSIARAADALFARGSIWAAATGEALAASAMLRVRGFNRHVVAALADRRAAGSATVAATGHVELVFPNRSSTRLDPKDDPLAPAPGANLGLRACDFYARAVASRSGAPRFEIYWPIAARNAAIARLVPYVLDQLAR